MSELTSAEHRGWWAPWQDVLDFARGRLLSSSRWQDWNAAVETADRIVSISRWALPLAPGHQEVDLGLRAVIRRGRRPEPPQVRVRHFRQGSSESGMGWAQLDLPVAIPAAWTHLPSPAFRLCVVSAILDTLAALGAVHGIGPPPLRSRPTVAKTLDMDDEQRLALGRWLADQVDATEAGWAVVAGKATGEARRRRRRRFLDQLTAVRELSTPAPEALVAWQIQLLPAPSGDETGGIG